MFIDALHNEIRNILKKQLGVVQQEERFTNKVISAEFGIKVQLDLAIHYDMNLWYQSLVFMTQH